MGRKVHPTGFRIGVIRDWQAKWYGGKHYLQYLQEDLKLRQALRFKYADASISLVETDRQANKVLVNIYTARPGVVIGRGGQRVDEIRQYLESLIGGRVQLNILEVRQPELDAYLVARSVAEQIERRIAFRRAMKRAIFRTLEAGAKGVRISCSGRLGGTEIARREMRHQGQVPLHKLRADIDYGFAEAHTTLGRIGIKVWIYRGDILPQAAAKVEEAPAEAEAKEAAAPLAEQPAEPVAEKGIEAEPSPPAEVVAEVSEVAEAVPVEVEEKPKKRARAKKAEVAEAVPLEEEQKTKKRARAKKTEVAEADPLEV
ncbi:MAG: 30S ribosomal protein S3, partial [Dehalococcoidia bacterium]